MSGESDSLAPLTAGLASVERGPESRGWNRAVYALLGLIGLQAALILVVITGKVLRPYLRIRAVSHREQVFNGELAHLIKGPQGKDRREAAEVIVGLGPAEVIKALAATTAASSDQGTLTLSKPVNRAFAEVGTSAVDAMVQALASDRPAVRIAAADVLREMDSKAAKAVLALAAVVNDENRWVRSFACNALGNIGPPAAPAVDALLGVIRHQDLYTRRHAIVALGRIGPLAVKAVPAIQQRADDPDEKDDVREAAIEALYEVNLAAIESSALAQASQEIRDLTRRLHGSDQFEAVPAAKTLARKGPEARLAIPSLALALQHGNKWIRVEAALALAQMGREAKVVRPALEQATADPEPEVRDAASKALEAIIGP
jgi:HEAT repeat protein